MDGSSPRDRTGRGGEAECFSVKDVGEPCAGEPHARFDGEGLETGVALWHVDMSAVGKPAG